MVTVTATADAYDGPLVAIRSHAEDLGAWLAIWESRTEPVGMPPAAAKPAHWLARRFWEAPRASQNRKTTPR